MHASPRRFARRLGAALLFGGVVFAVDLPAQSMTPEPKPAAGTVIADALVVRPLMLVRTLLGFGVFVVSLPFTVPGDHVAEAGEVLVVDPARETFMTPLGEPRR